MPEDHGDRGLYLFFALNYLAQGLGGIVYEPISYLLKDSLGLSAGQSAVFIGWMTFPFLLKPLFGVLSDLCAYKGRRRRPLLRLLSGLAALAWICLALRGRHSYVPLLAALIMANVGLVAADVACDAVMVEQGKKTRKTGIYQAVQIGVLYASLVFTGLGGGWLSAHMPIARIFLMASIFPLMILWSSRWSREGLAPAPARRGLSGILSLLKGGRFWALSLFIFLFNFYPFLGTAQFYYQSEFLKLSPIFIGSLSTLAGLAGAMGAGFYARSASKLISPILLLRVGVLAGGPLSLLYLLYLGPISAAALTLLFGFSGVVFRLALMDLAAQSCPDHAEASSFALYMSVFNLAAWASNMAGGKLYDVLRGHWATGSHADYQAMAALTLIGTASTLCCLPLLSRLGNNSATA
ncbi:MAG: MFS transporter [Elusimicrobia bacterium]|nr:MFS transporter [Elusimicrobiota bacterium]